MTLRHPALRTNSTQPWGQFRRTLLLAFLLASSASFVFAQGNYSVAPASQGATTDSGFTPSRFTPPRDGESDWKNLGGTDWNTGANWTGVSGGSAPPAPGDVATFKAAFSSGQPNLSISSSIAGIYFKGTGSSGYDITSSTTAIQFTLTGTNATGNGGTSNSTAAAIRGENTSGTNTIDAPIILGAAATQVFFQAAGGTLVVNSIISSTNPIDLSLKGAGTIQLNGPNTFSGGASIDQPNTTVVLGNDSALGTGTFTVNNTSILQASSTRALANNIVEAADLTISGGSPFTFGGTFTSSGSNSRLLTVSNTGGLTINGNVFLSDSNTLARSLTISGTSAVTINGVITNNAVGNTLASSLAYTGSSTLTLTNTNTYTGNTSVSGGGTISVASIGNSGAAGNLGAGTAINLGGGANSGTLLYTGTGESTSKIINLSGTTGGATIDQSGTGLLKFTGTNTASGAGIKTLTLQGSTAGTGEIAGAIVDNSGTNTTSLVKAGSGTWTLSGANTYTGTTTINASGGTLEVANNSSTTSGRIGSGATITINSGGTLLLSGAGSADRINNAAGIALVGGTLAKGFGASEGSASAIGMGALTLTGTGNKIDFGASPGTLSFATFVANSQVLSIVNYAATGSPGGPNQLIFHEDESGALTNFDFGFGAGVDVAEQALAGGFFEVYATAVPEPSTWVAAALALGAIACTQRRRIARLFKV